jgi:hypothetical protein
MLTLETAPRHVIERIERDLGLSTVALAQAIGATPRTVERWRSGTTYPQHEARRRLAALVALDERLCDTFASAEAIRAWLHAENRYLGGLAPADAIRAGRIDRAEAALEALDSGIFV